MILIFTVLVILMRGKFSRREIVKRRGKVYFVLLPLHPQRFLSRSRRHRILENGKRTLREEGPVLILAGARKDSSKIARVLVLPLKLSLYVIVLILFGLRWSCRVVSLTAHCT